MIRQTVTCDVCGVHKKEANHWFMAFEHKGALKLSPWGKLSSVRPSMKHLCGQKCVHRLVDEFMAGHASNGEVLTAHAEPPAGAVIDEAALADGGSARLLPSAD